MWVLQHGLETIWMISYIFSYGHLGGMRATLHANPAVTAYTLLSSLIYTASSIAFRPDAWNVPAVLHRFVFDVHKMLFGGTIVFFKLRNTRVEFDKFFAPKKGCFGILWIMGDVLIWDNRCIMHRRDAFDPTARRRMHRAQTKGDRPFH